MALEKEREDLCSVLARHSDMKQRQSNMEFLRIVSMMMVLMVHFVGATFGLPTPEELTQGVSWPVLAKVFLESASIIGVNCFVLISGYFGIRASWRGLLNFTWQCVFASLLVYVVSLSVEPFSAQGLLEAFRVYSATDLWFVPAYLVLYLLSPLINGGLASMSDRQIAYLLAALVFVNVYLGWMCGGKVNPYGYNEMQMLFLYISGYAIKRNLDWLKEVGTWMWLVLYAVAVTCVSACAFVMSSRQTFAYNSPFVFMASVSFFLIFAVRNPFYSRALNRVASSAFMVYLIHKSPFVWRYLRQWLHSFADGYDLWAFLCLSAALFVGVFTVGVVIDKLRLHLTSLVLRALGKLKMQS